MGDINLEHEKVTPFAMGGHSKTSFPVIQGSSSYATGGDKLTARQCRMTLIEFCSSGMLSESGTYLVYVKWTASEHKGSPFVLLKWVVVATGAQVASGVDLSGEYVHLMVCGRN